MRWREDTDVSSGKKKRLLKMCKIWLEAHKLSSKDNLHQCKAAVIMQELFPLLGGQCTTQ